MVWTASEGWPFGAASPCSRSTSAYPRIAVRGVRISWLMLARNSLLALFAASARRLASRSSVVRLKTSSSVRIWLSSRWAWRSESSWIAWAGLMIVMLLAFGPRHPQTVDEHVPLDPARKWLAGFALFMFVVSFTPAPMELIDVISEPSQDVDRIDVERHPPAQLGHPVDARL